MDWLPQLDRCDDLEQLKEMSLQCRRCGLRENARGVVFGEGDACATIMFVGEAPGADEDRLGRPFVGTAGQLLDKILAAAGFARESVYITNVAKCRPPDNRLPKKEEAEACFPYLIRQIELIQPRILVCLGTLATQYLVYREAKVALLRGQVFEKGGIKIIPTYHPAALLRDASKKKLVWQDFQHIKELYDQLGGKA
ncbi:MAG: uracil-DNA glycosylase [Bacillota bacterium]|nr:uracil-DNA glycosylase [Bacillota bacterium]